MLLSKGLPVWCFTGHLLEIDPTPGWGCVFADADMAYGLVFMVNGLLLSDGRQNGTFRLINNDEVVKRRQCVCSVCTFCPHWTGDFVPNARMLCKTNNWSCFILFN